MYGGLQYTPQLQAGFQLQWLAVIMVRINVKNEWWRPCMGFYVGDKWFATSSVCFIGMDENGIIYDTNTRGWEQTPAHLVYVASGFYTLNTSNYYIFATNNMYDVHKFRVMQEYKDFQGNQFLKGNILMLNVGRHPYGITNAPLSTKKFNIEEMNDEDCYLIGYDDQMDTNIFPTFRPSLRVVKLKGMLNDCSSSSKSPPKYTSNDRFDFCAQTAGDVGVCIHDVGAPVVCNNVVQGMMYRVGTPDCPMNGRGWRHKEKGGEIYENAFPHLPKKPLPGIDSANGFLDISLYKESFEKFLRYEDEYSRAEDKYVLYKAEGWTDAPISARMTLPTRPFPDWSSSTLVFEEWPITLETTTLADHFYNDENGNPITEKDVDDEYSDDQIMDDFKCQYSHSYTLQHAMKIWPILLINLLIF